MNASMVLLNSARLSAAAMAVALSAALGGCAGSEGGDLPDRGAALLPTGAADGFGDQVAIPISPGETVEGQAGGTAFTLFQVELSRGSSAEARVEQTAGDLAPMAFLYEELADLARPEAFLRPAGYAYDDSSLEISWPILRSGSYFLVVAAYGETTGSFSLGLSASQIADGPPLTDAEEEQVASSLDNICPDTFCGGDFNYRVDTLDCDGAGRCDVGMRVQSFSDSEGWTAGALDGHDASELAATGACEEGGTYQVRLTGTVGDEDGAWIVTDCILVGDLFTFEDIAVSRSWGLRYSERLYEGVLDCVDAIDGILYSL